MSALSRRRIRELAEEAAECAASTDPELVRRIEHAIRRALAEAEVKGDWRRRTKER